MPTPTQPITLGAQDALIVLGTNVIFRNLSRSGKVTKEGANGEAITTGPDWADGDEISIEVYGKYNASAKVTVAKGKASTKGLSLSEDTSTIGINL